MGDRRGRRRADRIVNHYFPTVALREQNILQTEANWTKILEAIPDTNGTARAQRTAHEPGSRAQPDPPRSPTGGWWGRRLATPGLRDKVRKEWEARPRDDSTERWKAFERELSSLRVRSGLVPPTTPACPNARGPEPYMVCAPHERAPAPPPPSPLLLPARSGVGSMCAAWRCWTKRLLSSCATHVSTSTLASSSTICSRARSVCTPRQVSAHDACGHPSPAQHSAGTHGAACRHEAGCC